MRRKVFETFETRNLSPRHARVLAMSRVVSFQWSRNLDPPTRLAYQVTAVDLKRRFAIDFTNYLNSICDVKHAISDTHMSRLFCIVIIREYVCRSIRQLNRA